MASSKKMINYMEKQSIPSMVDGLTPTQRKVLFCAFKMNLVNEIDVSQLSGFVLAKTSHPANQVSRETTIVGMAQNFVGSNNVNLLMPNGQFGTRTTGGKDAAKATVISTQLADVTRFIFRKEDDVLLDYLKKGGLQIEPVWYMPIIPMVLVNGSKGTKTGRDTFIPNYNPKDIIANIRRLINNESLKPMDPSYKNFNGIIQRAREESGVTYTVTGTIEVVDGNVGGVDVKLRITELPILKWTRNYKEFLWTMVKDGFIKTFDDNCCNQIVEFTVILSKRNYKLARKEGLEKKFKLITSLKTSNKHLFDKDNKIVEYDSPEQILKVFFHLRLEYYRKRKKQYLEIYKDELLKLDNQVSFIQGVIDETIILVPDKAAELVAELRLKGFSPIPKVKPVEPVDGATEDEVVEGSEDSDFDYLLSMPRSSCFPGEFKKLRANRDKVCNRIEDLKEQSETSLWLKDLEELENALDDMYKREAEEASKYASVSDSDDEDAEDSDEVEELYDSESEDDGYFSCYSEN